MIFKSILYAVSAAVVVFIILPAAKITPDQMQLFITLYGVYLLYHIAENVSDKKK